MPACSTRGHSNINNVRFVYAGCDMNALSGLQIHQVAGTTWA
ncbi:hypothetical protein BN1843_2770 [Escherichia coli]|nr:hypothetical protein BN1843_2770 [Escherichia coli]